MLNASRRISRAGSSLAASTEHALAPAPAMLLRALRQIGYSFEQAVSDLVDNSVSAGASSVLVRFVIDGDRIRSVIFADDGDGMSPERLAEAMRFGSETDVTRRTLGKYGMGMKLASLSHARTVTVISNRAGAASGRRWSVDGIGRGWNCEVLSESDVADTISAPWGELNVRRCGTLVFWDDVDRLPTGKHGLRDLLRQLQRRLQTHLGMTFHRFLEGTGRGHRLRIVLDLQRESFTEASHQVEVHPLNPFGYEESGHSDYPQKFPISLGTDGDFEAEAHIWPANSVSESYRLGNKAAARQGFYFYRHDRLIQAGGWNGLVQADSEPHSSLARVSIDLPESLDHAFGLNVQKSAVVVPPTFLLSIESARSRTGASFDDYRRAAQQTYRHDDRRAERHRPVVPGAGVPAAVRRLVLSRLSNDAEVRAVDFRWASLEDPDAVFEIDRERRRVLINRRLKQAGIDDSTGDARLLKVCLYFLLQDDIDSERLSGNRRDRLSLLNEAIGRTLYS